MSKKVEPKQPHKGEKAAAGAHKTAEKTSAKKVATRKMAKKTSTRKQARKF
jgi:hypothetical protein